MTSAPVHSAVAMDDPEARLLDDAVSLHHGPRGLRAYVILAAPGALITREHPYFELRRNTYGTLYESWAKVEIQALFPGILASSLSTPGVLALWVCFDVETPQEIEVSLGPAPRIERVRHGGRGPSPDSRRTLSILESLGGLGSLMTKTNLALTQWSLARDIPLLGRKLGTSRACAFSNTMHLERQPYTTWTSPLRRYPDLLHQLQLLSYLETGAPAWEKAHVDEEGQRIEDLIGEPRLLPKEKPDRVLWPMKALKRFIHKTGALLESSYERLDMEDAWRCTLEIQTLGTQAQGTGRTKSRARRAAAQAMLTALRGQQPGGTDV